MTETFEIKFNTPFDKAREAAQRRGVVLTQDYYGKLPKEMRSLSNTISYIQSVEQIQTILDDLKRAIDSGNSFEKWRKDFNPEKFGITKAHAETVYRNALQTQYSVGRWEQAQMAKKTHPYLRYVTINDSRTSQCCRALSGIIRPIDSPFWATHTPPNHHRCRSIVVSLTAKEAQKRSPAMVGLNQPESPDMQPQKGWDYNPALSHQKQMTDLAKAKIEKLPPVIKSKAEKILADKATMIDKQAFADFVEKVTPEDYKARHEYMKIGALPDYVMSSDFVAELKPINNEIHASDYKLKHALREMKVKHGAALSNEQVLFLVENLAVARWFYDSKHNNLISAVYLSDVNKFGKAVIDLNFSRSKQVHNLLKTMGLIEEYNLSHPDLTEITP